MKVERKQTEVKFKPIEITITIESQEELDSLTALSLANVSVPNTVLKCYPHKKPSREILENFLSHLEEILDK